ncbi:heavy-metal-associated domain-containing protein [Oryzomonas japonica]|uniref:Heavy-metal-associated domain-containing protein n=1 Tax=Oryzomonas japonica TaxID=2603858 RepID=A0A7J4ZQF1_9BACT|nr:heavy-metal-associated domain-containing protein [Oryzomonas japonica]KAB0665101.1 heavy-metal-associated domain-containing protein [Oryzomonas japonica]
MKNRIINTVLVVTAIVFLALLAVHVRAGATADSVAVLKTAGMTCGSCADRITKTLRSTKGVATTEVDLEGGWVIVGYDTKAIKPEVLAENVKKAGFASTVQEVVTPEQYRRITGKDVGASGAGRQGCCGSKGCGTGTTTK